MRALMNRAEAEGTTSLGPVGSEWSVSLYFSDPSALVALAMPLPTFYGDRPRGLIVGPRAAVAPTFLLVHLTYMTLISLGLNFEA